MISDYKFYLKLLVRRSPVMIVLFLVCAIAGVVIAQRLPTMYKTSATLLVESAQISDDLVRSTVQITAAEQLQVIQQRLMTRANLIDIANATNVLPNIREMNPDEVVAAMRQATVIRRTSGRDQATLMTIAFEGGDPRKIVDVVNRYVTIVLATNSNFRAQQAEGTLAFFQQEVRSLSEELDRKSADIVSFKNANADALPENLDYRLGRQALLQERISRAERDLDALIAQRENIQRIYDATGSLERDNPLSPEESRLRALEGELQLALSIYSETNPKVRNLRAQIDVLQAQVDAQNSALAGDESTESTTTALDVSLAEIDARSVKLRQDIAEITSELTALESSIERTPVNGITLDAMDRELQNTQQLYSAAVNRLSEARMSERVEISGAGERITELEAATVPNEPSSPNRPKVMVMGIGAGLGLAAAFFVLLELINTSIRRPADIMKSMQITPLATVPRIESLTRKRWRRVAQIVSVILVLAGVPALLWAVDTHYMPLDLLYAKIINRFG